MKYAFAAIALAAVARAQTLGDVPKCAIPCLDEAIKSETTCAIEDLACVCENFSAIQGVATGCVLEACGPEVAVGKFSFFDLCTSQVLTNHRRGSPRC